MSAAPLMTVGQAHALLTPAVPAARLCGDAGVPLARVHSDTRSLQPGDLFVALRGERFDAHAFLGAARAAGAVAALAEHGLADAGLPGIEVPDALAALQALAAAWRRRLQLPLVAVAGSNGKTTVTQMTASILRAWHGAGALATAGNLNNHIGVPLTLLRLRQDDTTWHQAAVLELGMNHPGEIAQLAAMAQPTVALVNNAQREHQEFMKTVDAVAHENGAVIEALGASGTAVYPADDAYAAVWAGQAGARARVTFALEGVADVTADARWVAADGGTGHWAATLRTPAGDAAMTLAVAGRHNLKNALAAAAAALAAGAPLASVVHGLESFRPVAGRSQLRTLQWHGSAVALIDDSYNANPDSVRAAIDVLATAAGPRWLVLGDMGEVGDAGEAFHAEVGHHARDRGIEAVWTAGTLCAAAAEACGPRARHFDTVEALLAALAGPGDAPPFRTALVKGSRFMRMERVVQALTALAEPSAAQGTA